MQYKENDLIKLTGQGETVFRIVMASQSSGNLMLVRENTSELWSAHVEDVAEQNPKI
jgi:hypothetical protein